MSDNRIKTIVELDVNQAQRSIVSLNAAASDSTKSLEERVAAKNKVVELQNQLSKKTIDALENERRTLEGRGASEKELKAIFDKLNKAKLDALKLSESGTVATNRLTAAQDKSNKVMKDGQDPVKNLDKATGGLVEKFKLLAANPIILIITLLVGAFMALKSALASGEEGQNKLAKISAVLGSVLGNVTDVVSDLAELIIDVLSGDSEAIKSVQQFGKKVWDFVGLPIKNIITVVETAGKVLTGLWNGGVSGAVNALKEGASGIAGNFNSAKASIDSAKTSLEEFTAEAIKDAQIAADLADKQAKLDVMDRDLILDRAKANNKVADLRDKAMQKDKYNAGERIKFLKDAGAAELAVTNKEIAAAKIAASIAKENNTLSKTNKENALKQTEAEAKVIDLKTKQLTLQRSMTGQVQAFIKEEEGLNKKAASDRIASSKKASDEILSNKRKELKALIDLAEIEVAGKKAADPKADTLAEEKKILTQKRDLELMTANLLESEKAVINSKYAAQEVELVRQTEADKTAIKLAARNAQIENEFVLDGLEIQRRKDHGENTLALELELLEKKRVQDLAQENLTVEQKAIINEMVRQTKVSLEANDAAAKLESQIEFDEQDLEARRLRGENIYGLEKALREEARALELSDATLTAEAKAIINQKYDNANTQARQTAIDTDLAAAGEAFGVSKEIKMAEMIMAAPTAIGNSFAKASEVYAPPLSGVMGAVGAATVIVPIIKGLADIKKTRFPGKKGGGGSGGGGGSISSAVSSVSSASVGDISANNIARLGVDPNIGNGATSSAANRMVGGNSLGVVFSESKYNDFKTQVQFKESKTTI
jgi:hypothetical protein